MRYAQLVVFSWVVLLSLSTGCFGQTHDRLQNARVDKVRNNLWPMPFRSMDSCSVLQYIEAQRNNGWKLNNTLGNAMFDPSVNSLSDSGKSHLRWIVNQAPATRRVVFVLRGNNDEQTRRRVEATQLAISEILPVGQLPEIYLTNSEPVPSSGVYQTAIHRAMVASVPSPRLTESSAAPTAAGTGGGN